MVGHRSAATIRVMKSAVASSRSDMNESIGFECADEFAGGNAPRQFQTLTTTAEESVDAMSAAGGMSFPSSASSSTIMCSTSPMCLTASSLVSPHVAAPMDSSAGQYARNA